MYPIASFVRMHEYWKFVVIDAIEHTMKHIFIYVVIIFFSHGCEEYEQVKEMDKPLEVWTFPPVDIDSSGATLIGEVFGDSREQIISFGFRWNRYNYSYAKYDTCIVFTTPTISSTTFTVRIDSLLVNKVKYKVEAFVITEDTTIVGNTINFYSKGSKNTNWNYRYPYRYAIASFNMYRPPYAITVGNECYLLSSVSFYKFNPETYHLERLNSYPWNLVNFITASLNNIIYVLVPNALVHYYNGRWLIDSQVVPFKYEDKKDCSSFSLNNKLYFINPEEIYCYDINTNSWGKQTSIPKSYGTHTGSVLVNNKAYIITNNKFLIKYDLETNKFSKIADSPGYLTAYATCFNHDYKLYFILKFENNTPLENYMDIALWSYDLISEEWNIVEALPDKKSPNFYFWVNQTFHIGYWAWGAGSGDYKHSTVWKNDFLKEYI